jgi:hypothetical protein
MPNAAGYPRKQSMKPPVLLALGLLLSSCAQTQLSQQTDLSIARYTPPPDALTIAEARAKQYWAKHQRDTGQETRYLAIESDSIPSANIPNLYFRLTNSPGVNSSDVEEYQTNSDIDIFCVNIFDTRTGQLVSPRGYAVVDEPGPGTKARFGPYIARFIGTGE